jgi:hypothetical protein
MHGSLEVVDEDRPCDPDLVPQPPRRRELVPEGGMRPEMLARMRLPCVDEVPAEADVSQSELVEQRTLCGAIRSSEGAELEHDAPLAPQLGQPNPLTVEPL